MNKKCKRWIGLLLFCFVLFGVMFDIANKVSATGAVNDLYKRAYANNLGLCYNQDVLKRTIELEKSPTPTYDPRWEVKDMLERGAGFVNTTSLGHVSLTSSSLIRTCQTLFLQKDSGSGYYGHSIFAEFGKSDDVPNGTNKARTFLTNMGYRPETEDENGYDCLSITRKDPESYNSTPDDQTYYVCWKENTYFYGADIDIANLPEGFSAEATYNDTGSYTLKLGSESEKAGIPCEAYLPVEKGDITMQNNLACGYSPYYYLSSFKKTFTEANNKYVIDNYTNAYKRARKWLTGDEGKESGLVRFEVADIINLYVDYLKDPEVSGSNPAEGTSCQVEKPESLVKDGIYYVYTGEGWCNIVVKNSVTDPKTRAYFGGFERFSGDSRDDKRYFPNKILTFEDLINDLAYWMEKDPEAAKAAIGNFDKKEETETEAHKDPPDLCYESAGAMGWVLCPAVVAASGIGQTMWGEIKNNLQFDASVLNSGDGVEQGWMAIRDVANTIFIILFLFVIFSQLTGVGIDNYGIKKILPKLIVIAILINLSFVLCRVFVDVSNIAGVGLENLFKSIAPEMPKEAGNTEGMLVGGATGLILAGIGVGVIFTYLNGLEGVKKFLGAAAIGILGAVIVVLLGILTIFLILAIRKAGIVLLTVLSPLAIVCYALPNTEKISKKWLDAFKALLIVYPICGAMVGAGDFAKVVLYSVNPLLSMMASVVPYFFVPVLLKNSLNAIGNLGGKISAIGRGLGKRGSGAATGAIKNNDRYKDWSNLQSRAVTLRRTQRRIDALSGQGELSDAQRVKLAQAERRKAAALAESEKDYATIYKNKDRGEVKDEMRRGLEGGDDVALIGASLDSVLEKGGESDVMEAIRDNDFNSLSSEAQHRALQSMINSKSEILQGFAKYRQTGGSGNFVEWMNGGTVADGSNPDIKSRSLAGHLKERGTGAMNNLSRDALKFLRENDNGWSGQLGSKYNEMIANAAINSTDPRAKTEAETMMRDSLARGASIDEFGLTANTLGSMRAETMKAILDGYKQNISRTHANLTPAQVERNAQLSLRTALTDQIAAARKDSMIMNRMNGNVKDILGL